MMHGRRNIKLLDKNRCDNLETQTVGILHFLNRFFKLKYYF